MRKRMLSMLLAMCLMVALTACGGTSSTDSNKSSSAATSQTSSSGIVSLSPTSTPEPTPEPTATPEPTPEPVSIAETVAYEDDTLQILLQDFTLDGDGKMNVTTCARNLTSDTKYGVVLEYVSVNGVDYAYEFVDPSVEDKDYWFSYDVLELKNGEEISIDYVLELYAGIFYESSQDIIGRPSDIEFGFSIYKVWVDYWGNEYLDKYEFATAHIYPYGEENKKLYVRENVSGDVTFVENENFVITAITGDDIDHDFEVTGGTLLLFVENKTDKYLKLNFTNITIDEELVNEWGSGTLTGPGEKSFCRIYSNNYDGKIKDAKQIAMDLLAFTDFGDDNSYLFEDTVYFVP